MDVYDRIDELLNKKGVSRRKAAQLAGIIPGTLNSALYRKKGLSAAAVSELARALGADANYLLYGEVTTVDGYFNGEPASITKWPEGHPLSSNEAYLAHKQRMQQPKERLDAAFGKLNDEGQEVAAERVEELTKIMDYQKSDDAEKQGPSW